jgi:hypothetical protein
MKKILVTCVAIVALFAVAGSASAITCTVDQRPAATLLVPFFQASFNADGTVSPALDTLVTIGNASNAPMIAHVNVYNDLSELVLDFNIALTGYDIQSFSVANTLRGNLTNTPIGTTHLVSVNDACQRNPLALTYTSPPAFNNARYLRIRPTTPATPLDNSLATTLYGPGPFAGGFLFNVLDSLDDTPDTVECGGVDGEIEGLIKGYITIDHANYCNLSNPRDFNYYELDAIGMENNLWGDVLFTSNSGLPTIGSSTVNIEAASTPTGVGSPLAANIPPTQPRTFYARYTDALDPLCAPANCPAFGTNPWNQGIGDQREPLGLRYAARWFDSAGAGITSFFLVWRGGFGDTVDLINFGDCDIVEPVVSLVFYDEDENTVTSGVCPSPCQQPTFNFPLETQRRQITGFSHPNWPAGWVMMNFVSGTGVGFRAYDQAWVEYDFIGPGAFLSASSPATQLDPSSCNPIGVTAPLPVIVPSIPAGPGGQG